MISSRGLNPSQRACGVKKEINFFDRFLEEPNELCKSTELAKMVTQWLALARQCFRDGDLEQAQTLCREALRTEPGHAETLYLLGKVRHRQQHLEEALSCFDRVLQSWPQLAECHHARGLVLMDRGDLDSAEAAFRQALLLKPAFLPARIHLGQVLQDLGKAEDAEQCYRVALQQQPDLAEAHADLAGVLRARGQLEEAAQSYREALRLRPEFAAAHNNLGIVLQTLGNLPEAAACYRDALRRDATLAGTHYNLGNVVRQIGSSAEAAACYQQALRLQPGFAPAYNGLGLVYLQSGDLEKARECFQEALRLQPTLVEAHQSLGHLCLEQGQREEAVRHFRDVLRDDPECAPALAAVALHDLFPLSGDELGCMRGLLNNPLRTLDERARLHFGLGNLSDRAGVVDEAFAHFRQGNALRRELARRGGTAFDAGKHRAWVDRLIGICDAAYFRSIAGLGCDSERPVFIVGMPRSGTSLVEQILASHPDVYGCGELAEISRLVGDVTDYPAGLDSATIMPLAVRYLHHIARCTGTAPRVMDKMPLNFLHLGFIAALFPKARVIHCVRDALDVCFSCYAQDFQGNLPFTFDLEDLGNYYRDYERLMAHWRAVLPLPLLEVPYEDLVSGPEMVSHRMVEFCGLPWDERCLAYDRNPRAVHTASQLQVRQPIYKTSVGRWRRYASHLDRLIGAVGPFAAKV
jgi:tetratricopeptide (TPR) repeat protein